MRSGAELQRYAGFMALPSPRLHTPSSSPPAARGELCETSFAQLLARVHQHALTGTLLLELPTERIAVHVHEGLVCAASADIEHRSLAPLMVALCRCERGSFTVQPGEDLTAGDEHALRGRFHPLALLTAAVRAHACDRLIDVFLGRFGERPLVLTRKAELRCYGFNGRERDFIRELNRQPAPLTELLDRGLPADDARRMVLLLTLTRALVPLSPSVQRLSGPVTIARINAVENKPAKPQAGRYSIVNREAATASTPLVSEQSIAADVPFRDDLPAPPRQLPPGLRQRWVKLLLDYRRMRKLNHFQLLGVDRKADEATIEAHHAEQHACFELGPLPPICEPLAELASEAQARLATARRTLCDADLRARYLEELRERRQGGGGALRSEAADAASDFARARELMERRLYTTALEAARSAIARDSGRAAYHALYGALVYLTATRDREQQRDGLHHLATALRLDPQCVMAHHYRALFLKRAGDRARALTHFQQAARLDPRNMEILRELRLLEQRERASSTSGLMRRIRASLRPGNDAG